MELIAGHVLFRHGDRTPVTTFPTDPVKPSDWPNGYGQLTSIGIEQQHQLGIFLRSRYDSLLSPNYTASEISVRSTDLDRTLMSAQSNLIGLYPTNATEDKVPIQPIPIHTVSTSLDFLLGISSCPRYDQIEIEVDGSDEVNKVNQYYKEFFTKLEAWTNMTNITVYNAWKIADTIFVENLYNKTPQWAEDDAVRQNLSDINDLAFHFLFENNDTKRIRGGPAIQDIWLNMNNSINGKTFNKVKIYSAHDTTIAAVLSFLGINYPHQPQYASALFVDLYQQNSSYFVKVEYKNVTLSNTSYAYVLNGCPAAECPFDTFTGIYQPAFPASPDVECAKKEPPMPPMSNNKKLVTILIVVIVALVVIIFVMFSCLYLRRSRLDSPILGSNRSVQSEA